MVGFRQREQITVLVVRSRVRSEVRRVGAGGQVPTKKRKVPKALGQQFGRAGAKSRPEKRPTGDVAEFRNERIPGDQRKTSPLPGVEQSRGAPRGDRSAASRIVVS